MIILLGAIILFIYNDYNLEKTAKDLLGIFIWIGIFLIVITMATIGLGLLKGFGVL